MGYFKYLALAALLTTNTLGASPVAAQTTLPSLTDAGPEDCCGFKTGHGGIEAQFLLETCWAPGQTAYGMVPNFDCQSYVLGVVDTLRATSEWLDATLCLPPVLTAGTVLALVAQDYGDEVDGQRRAADLMIDALYTAFPCPHT